jgi:hypothetical protein
MKNLVSLPYLLLTLPKITELLLKFAPNLLKTN